MALIDTKTEQLKTAVVNTYQALGGGVFVIPTPTDFHGQFPYTHTVRGTAELLDDLTALLPVGPIWQGSLGGQQEYHPGLRPPGRRRHDHHSSDR